MNNLFCFAGKCFSCLTRRKRRVKVLSTIFMSSFCMQTGNESTLGINRIENGSPAISLWAKDVRGLRTVVKLDCFCTRIHIHQLL